MLKDGLLVCTLIWLYIDTDACIVPKAHYNYSFLDAMHSHINYVNILLNNLQWNWAFMLLLLWFA